MRLRDIGEFGLIERIVNTLGLAPSDVAVGIGDDVAVLRTSGPEYLLATCDAQVENVHFRLDVITPYQLGRKTAAINVSDIASMGGEPTWALVSLALPGAMPVSFVDGLYDGMRDELAIAGAVIVGGNMSGVRREAVIDFFLLGRVTPENLVLRKGAREGDLIFVTGWPGESRAGLELILKPDLIVSEPTRGRVLERHLTPMPRLREGQALGRSGKVHAMMDVSDGVLSDLQHLCKASGVGAEILEADLPISAACRETASAAGVLPEQWALAGGEDYELLFTACPEDALEIIRMLDAETGAPCRVIGRIIGEEAGIQVLSLGGQAVSFADDLKGWDHFVK